LNSCSTADRSAGTTRSRGGGAERQNILTTAITDAALVEQTAAAAAGSLKDQAVGLSENVSVFRLTLDAARF
jgi:hypothetical protein